nr:MAG TPA: hypothetical protein [Caudoviricetes sp.]DAY34101.1 MAG TPA: hypothetical protein [Caudoviricetes sp.]
MTTKAKSELSSFGSVARRKTLRQKGNHPKTPIPLSENGHPRGEI